MGWALAGLIAEWGIDEVQRWIDEQTGHRHTSHGHPDYTEPNRPDSSRSSLRGDCVDRVEEAEFKELEDAARCGCEEY
jgi:hypothetical protein